MKSFPLFTHSLFLSNSYILFLFSSLHNATLHSFTFICKLQWIYKYIHTYKCNTVFYAYTCISFHSVTSVCVYIYIYIYTVFLYFLNILNRLFCFVTEAHVYTFSCASICLLFLFYLFSYQWFFVPFCLR